MIEIEVNCWSEYQAEISRLEQYREEIKETAIGHVSELLYRGQSDERWKLRTTLERARASDTSLYDYYLWITILRSEIESWTDRRWKIPTLSEYEKKIEESLFSPDIEICEYMAYLRHHGLPSPLLDWTSSPAVAAFFAYRNPPEEAQAVAVYVYLEHVGSGHGGWANRPKISSIGPTIRTHKRHYLQQCQYTYCSEIKEAHDRVYASHEDVFTDPEPEQDYLWKIIFPINGRRRVLSELNKFNVNAYSLFTTEESLMEHHAIKRFVVEEE